MSNQWNYKVSMDYKIRVFLIAVVAWVVFNIATGLLTGNTEFPDNYFLLFVLTSIAAFKCSYSVSFKDGQMNEHQMGMLTSNIDLYKIKDVNEVNGSLKLFGADDSQFTINYDRLPKNAHDKILASIEPLYGKEPEVIAEKSIKYTTKKVLENYTQSIIGGIVLSILSATGYFTGTIFVPSTHGFIERSDGEQQFYFFLATFAVMGIASIVYGMVGLLARKNA